MKSFFEVLTRFLAIRLLLDWIFFRRFFFSRLPFF